jgi:hypothetical protein
VVATEATSFFNFNTSRDSLGNRLSFGLGNRLSLAPGSRLSLALGNRLSFDLGNRRSLALGNRRSLALGNRLSLALGSRRSLALGNQIFYYNTVCGIGKYHFLRTGNRGLLRGCYFPDLSQFLWLSTVRGRSVWIGFHYRHSATQKRTCRIVAPGVPLERTPPASPPGFRRVSESLHLVD